MYDFTFRGRRCVDNHYVYGDLTHYNKECFIDDWKVFADSVALKVGYDRNGDPVYTDSQLINPYTKENINISIWVELSDGEVDSDYPLGSEYKCELQEGQ